MPKQDTHEPELVDAAQSGDADANGEATVEKPEKGAKPRAKRAVRSAIAEEIPSAAAPDSGDSAEDDDEVAIEEDEDGLEQLEDDDGSDRLVLRLTADLRRRLRRRAEREGVETEELAQELLSAAIRQPVTPSLVDVLARLDKLERRVTDLTTAPPRQDVAPTVTRRDDRSSGDYGSRPSYGDRGGFGGGDRRGGDRPPYGQRSPGGGGFRSERRFDDRPRSTYSDRGGERGFDRGGDRGVDRGGDRGYDRHRERDNFQDRPARRWEAPRRGE